MIEFRACETDGFEGLFIHGRLTLGGWADMQERHARMRTKEAKQLDDPRPSRTRKVYSAGDSDESYSYHTKGRRTAMDEDE